MADDPRFDRLLNALLTLLERQQLPDSKEPMSEAQLTRAMVRALKEAKSFIRPRTFGGN